jgi:hypothetical protein
MDADEGLTITVNVIGDPAVPTLVDVPTETDKLVGLVVEKKTTTPAAKIITMTISAATERPIACMPILKIPA